MTRCVSSCIARTAPVMRPEAASVTNSVLNGDSDSLSAASVTDVVDVTDVNGTDLSITSATVKFITLEDSSCSSGSSVVVVARRMHSSGRAPVEGGDATRRSAIRNMDVTRRRADAVTRRSEAR